MKIGTLKKKDGQTAVALNRGEGAPIDLGAAYTTYLKHRGVANAAQISHQVIGTHGGTFFRGGPEAIEAAQLTQEWLNGNASEFEMSDFTYLPPVPDPSKVVCVAVNNPELFEPKENELPDHPIWFLKAPTALNGHEQPIVVGDVGLVQPEVEMCVVIGRSCRCISEGDWDKVVAGYSVLNDVTGAGMSYTERLTVHLSRTSDGQPEPFIARPMARYKGADTFGPMGPWVVTKDEIPDPHAGLKIQAWFDGELAQDGRSDEYRFRLPEILSFVSKHHTLYAGDVVSMGTARSAKGSHLRKSDLSTGKEIVCEIEKVGRLVNPLSHEPLRERPRWIDGE